MKTAEADAADPSGTELGAETDWITGIAGPIVSMA
jgi:hypothetical protein